MLKTNMLLSEKEMIFRKKKGENRFCRHTNDSQKSNFCMNTQVSEYSL